MAAIQVEISDTLKSLVDEQTRSAGLSSVSEYISKMLWDAREAALPSELERQLLDGDRSESIEMAPERWQEKKRQLIAQMAKRA